MSNNQGNKKNKSLEAKEFIEVSKETVAKVEADLAETKASIAKAAEEFDLAKRTFKNVSLKKADSLLAKVGFEYITFDEAEAFDLSIDSSENERFTIQELHSGKFTGFILAILAALLIVAGWAYVAMLKLEINPSTLNLETATSHVTPILTWIGGTEVLGAVILGFSALIVAWIVYALRTSMKARKNLRLAKETFEKSNEYCLIKENSQQEMQKIEEHLKEVSSEIANLEVALGEQTSMLKRIIHVEGLNEEDKEYHPSSKAVMRTSEKIMRATEHLIETPITEDKKLNFKSVQALNSAKDTYAEYLSHIYN